MSRNRKEEDGGEHPEVLRARDKNRAMHYDLCKEAADYMAARVSAQPEIGIICGTGLGEERRAD